MHQMTLLAGCVLALSLVPSVASADIDSTAEPIRERRVWYGWQTLIADGTSLFVLPTAGGLADEPNLVQAGFAGYLLASPVVHFAHGNPGRGFGSLGLRVALPIVGGGLGAAATSEAGCELCGVGGLLIGAVAGVGTAIAIDASLLAYDVEPATVSVMVVPAVAGEHTEPRLLVGGTF